MGEEANAPGQETRKYTSGNQQHPGTRCSFFNRTRVIAAGCILSHLFRQTALSWRGTSLSLFIISQEGGRGQIVCSSLTACKQGHF